LDKKASLYDKEKETTSEAYDAREVTRAIKDEEMD